MKIYIDSDYKCHVSDDGTLKEHNVPFFDGKCDKVVEGYRYVPHGETWVRSDGVAFAGEMISPWRDYNLLMEFQKQHDDLEAAHLAELGGLVEEIYMNDLEVIG